MKSFALSLAFIMRYIATRKRLFLEWILQNKAEHLVVFTQCSIRNCDSGDVFLKLWAAGQSDAFLLLFLGFTVDVHTFCMLSI